MSGTKETRLGPRFQEALVMASKLHENQVRKMREVPYISHILSVTALVLQDGGSEDEAIAALLHDAVEDQGGEDTLKNIREKFGEFVASVVLQCSDTLVKPKPPWKARKEQHLANLEEADMAVLRIIAADKLHNARSILRDLRASGPVLWEHFNGGREGTLWYFKSLNELLIKRKPGYLQKELGRVIAEIEKLG